MEVIYVKAFDKVEPLYNIDEETNSLISSIEKESKVII